MSATSADARLPRASSRIDRLLAAVPVLAIALAIAVFYLVEAWTRHTPWVFTDELEWSQISRAIESTGHAARRGQPIYFKSLYAFFIAPWWAIHSTATAYAAIKYADALLMSSAAIPTYFLARMLVTKRAALAVAVLSVCIPGMAYATSIEPEVLAYPFYALASWLIVRALATGRNRDRLLAVAAAVVACLVRFPQFATVGASFAIAAAGLWVTGPRGRAVRRDWSRGDTIGAIVLLIGALFLFNRIFLQHVQEWQISTQYWKNRMVDLGLRAALAFTIGIGVLPVIGGFASLRLPERRGQPVYRAFAAYLASAILCVSIYTAVKAAFLSTVFATLTEERNMIYLSPLLLIGTAMVIEARKIDWRIVVAVSAFIVLLMFIKSFQLEFPYFESPGMAILTIPTRWGWTILDLRLILFAVLALSFALLAFRRYRVVALVALVLGGAWMLTSEIQTTRGFDLQANRFIANLPPHLDWVDREDGGRPATYIGQEIKDPNGLLLTEFWNRSIEHVDSLDGTAPGPGPTASPNILDTTGLLSGNGGTPYVLADNGVVLQAPVVDHWHQLVLYRTGNRPWRLGDALQQVYSDGWCPEWCSYTYFGPAKRGTLVVTLSRTGYNGSAPPGRVRVQYGSIHIDESQEPAFTKVYGARWVTVKNLSSQQIRIPVARAPVRVELRTPIADTFHVGSDPRNLSAQVGFQFIPAKG